MEASGVTLRRGTRSAWLTTRWAMAVVISGVTGCGEDATAPPPVQLEVSVTVEPAFIVPGQGAVVTASAELLDTYTLTRFDLAVSGLGRDTVLALPILGPGPHVYLVTIDVPIGPIEGSLHFRAYAEVGGVGDFADGSLVISDDGAPRLSMTAPQVVEPPDSLTVRVRSQDAAGITELAIRLEGAIHRDTVITSAFVASVEWTFGALIPSTAPLSDSVIVRATTRDGFGKLGTAEHVIHFVDTTQPALTVSLDTLHHAGIDEYFFPLTYVPGDTVRMRLVASDNRLLARLGYRMLQYGDSIATVSVTDSARFELVIPAGTNSPSAYIDVFAMDSVGLRSEQRFWAGVVDGTFRSFEVLSPFDDPLIEFDQQGGHALDARRDVLYFTTFTNQIQVLALQPLATRPPMGFGASVRGVDLVAGGDSLVTVVLGRPNLLLVWDVAAGPTTADTIPLGLLGDCDAWDMQVAANGYAVVTGWSASGCPTIEVNLGTGAQRLLDVPAALRNLVASGDHTRIVAWSQFETVVYRSETRDLTPVRALSPAPPATELPHAGPAIDRAGTAILMQNRLYDGEMSSMRWSQPDPGYLPTAAALSADGQVAFLGNWPGYWRIDAATGAVDERIILPRIPWRIVAHPDGERLIVFGWQWVGMVDLR
jgi:hypothetical protein